MHDIKLIRDNPDAFDAALLKRGMVAQSPILLELDEKRRKRLNDVQELQQRRNALAREIGTLRKSGGDATGLMNEANEVSTLLKQFESRNEFEEELNSILSTLPNIPAEDVPIGADETANEQIRTWGERKEIQNSLEHFEIGEKLGLMDFEQAGKISGSRFVILKGLLARLERELANFMLDVHTREFGYTEISPPLLVRDEALMGTGQLPKFADDLFKTTDGRWLIPTAEVPLTNLVADSILSEAELPMRFTALTHCFRAEAGAAGRDTRGMLRQHQFQKVELVSITTPEQSDEEHERMTACAEEILKRLGLHYRVMKLCSGDMGFSARRTYDIEVWLPGQKAYREISSCSSCGDFQARRMKARYRPTGSKETRFVHTLNGSGLAVGRTLIAVLENYYTENTMHIPEALKRYI